MSQFVSNLSPDVYLCTTFKILGLLKQKAKEEDKTVEFGDLAFYFTFLIKI